MLYGAYAYIIIPVRLWMLFENSFFFTSDYIRYCWCWCWYMKWNEWNIQEALIRWLFFIAFVFWNTTAQKHLFQIFVYYRFYYSIPEINTPLQWCMDVRISRSLVIFWRIFFHLFFISIALSLHCAHILLIFLEIQSSLSLKLEFNFNENGFDSGAACEFSSTTLFLLLTYMI